MRRLQSLLFVALLSAAVTLPLLAHHLDDAKKASNAKGSSSPVPPAIRQGLDSFRGDAMKAHDQFLASDLLEGRAPGTRGDELAMEYIAAQFQALGLQPDGDHGTYYQKVPLIGVTYSASGSALSFTKEGTQPIALKYLDDFVGTDESQSEGSTLDSELVFVGHGVVAPEYKWDDYKGLDTRGKTLVMLVDDPPANAKEPDLFKGKARTYYGRWTYKYEIGTAKGAQAVILIHTNDAAGYPWEVVRNSWGRESDFVKLGAGDNALHFAGWVQERIAENLFKAAGYDLAALTKAASSRDFKPVSLGGYHLAGKITSAIRPFDTANVVARLVGSDPKLRDEAILYTAHHDHLGIGEPDKTGDRIYNGAIDNASGCAILLDMARVWSQQKTAPKRSVIFAAVAAEEQGLLGSAYYGQHPSMPAGRIALNINFDAIPELGRVRDVTMNGVERTTFYPTAERITKALGITIVPDQKPEQGHYYRSDHFSLGKVGVPAFSVDAGYDIIGKSKEWGLQQAEDYNENHYHQPSDQFDPKWDWSEGVEMAQLGYWLGWEAANALGLPNWLPGDEFRAIRDKSLDKSLDKK